MIETQPTTSHGCRFEYRIRYRGGLVGYEPLFVTAEMIERGTIALIRQEGGTKANEVDETVLAAWRGHAEAVLRAALYQATDGGKR